MEAEPLNTDLPKRKRRWFQFRLRTLMVGITLLCAACAVWIPGIREQRELAAFTRERDEFVNAHPEYSFELSSEGGQWVFTMDRRKVQLERCYSTVALPLNSTIMDREQAAILFPEANVMAINPKYKPAVWPNPPVSFRGKWYDPQPPELVEFIPFPGGAH